ncbi:MAG TPA: ROK family protein, partial [Longimicrobium sp.]|nr:ROK family protein [Longimicrobium sp.]
MRRDDGRIALGVDVGGTKTEILLAGRGGRVLAETRIPTDPEGGAEATLRHAAAAAREAFGAAMDDAAAVGVSVAGQVGRRGMLLGAPNLGWTGVDVRRLAIAAFGLPTVVVNDVRAATWAEWRLGAGRGVRDLVVLFVGTGVGGGAVIGGRLLEGADGIAGELGHLTVVAGGRKCHCGNLGCLEAYCGGWALEERASQAALADPAAGAALLRLAGSAEAITGEVIAAARKAGDALATRLVDETADVLGAAVVGLVNALNPRRVILGGGVMDGFPDLLYRATAAVHARALPAARQRVEIVRAGLADDAPALGAADFALVRRPRMQ